MRSLWIASAVFFVGATLSMSERRDDTALLFATIGFSLVFIAESNFDWQHRITRSNWRRSVFEPSARTTILGKLVQVLAFVCLAGFLLVGRH